MRGPRQPQLRTGTRVSPWPKPLEPSRSGHRPQSIHWPPALVTLSIYLIVASFPGTFPWLT